MMSDFSLLSLNVFGLPFYLGWRRLARLARQLDSRSETVLCLQELQQNAYAALLAQNLRTYPHQVIQRNTFTPKGGLGVFSRLPVEQQQFDVYEERGSWWSISLADWALYKGILSVHLKVQGQEIAILNTHMNANYSGDWYPKNPLARLQHKQVTRLSHLIGTLPDDALVIVCGDLNFPRGSFLYEELVSHNGLVDPLSKDQRATYRPFPLVPSRWKIPLDYILVRFPASGDFQIQADILAVEDSSKRRSHQRFLTDHCALTLQVKLGAA